MLLNTKNDILEGNPSFSFESLIFSKIPVEDLHETKVAQCVPIVNTFLARMKAFILGDIIAFTAGILLHSP